MKFNRDRGKSRYGAETLHGAPHKPFLMLAIIQRIEEGMINSALIEPNVGLELGFWEHSYSLDIGRKRDMWLPFFHMQSEKFWSLVRSDGRSPDNDGQPKSTKRLRMTYVGAIIEAVLWSKLQSVEGRREVVQGILDENFHIDVHQAIIEQRRVIIESNNYAKTILDPSFVNLDIDDKPVRTAGFRKAIQTAYDHTCAFTGMRLLTPEYHTIIDAAHIKPWSISHNDSISNGMALSKHCHWAFDKGLLAVDGENRILISSVLERPNMQVEVLVKLENQLLRFPHEDYPKPDEELLAWHRENIFSE